MKPLHRQRVLWPTLIAGLTTVLIALGALQYRWSNEVSDAASARMRAVLSSSMLDFRHDFVAELSNIASGFPNGEDSQANLTSYAGSIRNWETANAHAGMVRAVYVIERHSGVSAQVMKFNAAPATFAETSWPPELDGLRDSFLGPTFLMRPNGREPRPARGEFQEPVPSHKGHRRFGRGESPERRGPPWFVDSSIPALIHPLGMPFSAHSTGERPFRAIVIELNQEFFAKQLFPELAQRYFPNSDALGYDVTLTSGTERQNLYSSNAVLVPADADATLDLLAPSAGQRSLDHAMPKFRNGPELPATARAADLSWGAPLLVIGHGPQGARWQLLVKNRQGSLEAVVGSLRRRNLALSFGILLVLAATMAMLIRASRGALRLAQLQMDFVAGVSHELRTPVTVISSAAENIADGVVQDREQLARYGNAIRSQAAQLRQLIEQILLFAATRRNDSRYDLHPASVEGVIDTALENTAELIRTAGFRVETSVQPGLPSAMVNVQALSQCLQNLITNAVKYGGDARWIGIGAALREAPRGSEIMITVSDRGIGIPPDELEHIFDPFYRGFEARAAQVHGSGLGLPLAKSMIEAMSGIISVESRPRAGSSFTIHLPVSPAAASGAPVTQPAVNPSASYSKS